MRSDTYEKQRRAYDFAAMPVLRWKGRVSERQLYDTVHPLQGMRWQDKKQPQQSQSNRRMEQEDA